MVSKEKNKRCFWTEEENVLLRELFRESYVDLGIKGIAEKLNKTIYAVLHKVRHLGIKIPRINWDNGFWWSEENIAILKERYQIDGPKKLAELLGTTRIAVGMKAKRLGIPSKNGRNHKPWEWKEWELEVLKNRYPTEDIKKLAVELGMPLYILQTKARKLGIKNLNRRERASKAKAENNKTCDIHYFDRWSPSMAWCLGFCFADASVTKRQGDIVIALAEKDKCILDFIKKELKSTREIYRVEGGKYTKDGYNHQDSYWLTLSSKVLVKRVMELGMKPRKTYNDDPFPNIPETMFSRFVSGYFDGDGSVCIRGEDNRCIINFVGSIKFITGIRDGLVNLAGMKNNSVRLEVLKNMTCARLAWSTPEDLTKFYNFIYPPKHGFCLKRKKDRLRNWLLDKGVLI